MIHPFKRQEPPRLSVRQIRFLEAFLADQSLTLERLIDEHQAFSRIIAAVSAAITGEKK